MEWRLDLATNIIALVLTIVILIILIFHYYTHYKLNYWKRRGVAQLSDINRIFGNFKDAILFRTAPGWHLGKLHSAAAKLNSPYIGFYIFHKPCLLLRDPAIIKQILIKDFENFSDRHFAGSQEKDSIGMKNLFGLKNPAWKYLRTKITPALTRGKLKQMVPLMINTAEPMRKYLNKKSNDGIGLIDAQDINYKYTADLIANIALGTVTNSFDYPNGKFTKAMMEFFHGFKRMVALITVFFMPELVSKIGSSILFNSTFVREIFWDAMKLREETGLKRGDFIDTLIQLKNGEQNSVYEFQGDNLLYQSGMFFSGFESSSTTASFTLMELAKNIKCQSLARDNIIKAINKYGWSYEAFNEMKYLDQCVAEGIRIHPSVSTIDRYTRDDYIIPDTNIIIEKGTAIYISLYGLQRDPSNFDEPDLFKPERFDDDKKISDAYIPFGLGPRMCVGMKIGQLHAKIVLAVILSEYEVYESEDEIKLDPRSTFTAAQYGINLHFRKIPS